MNKLKDMKEYLINKIETRFFELTKDVQKGVQVKKKAIDNRIKFLDRNFLQVIIPHFQLIPDTSQLTLNFA